MKISSPVLIILLFCGLYATAAVPDYVKGEVLVLYKQSASVKSLSAADNVPGWSRKTFARLSSLAGKKMQLIHDSNCTSAELMAILRTNANVEAVSPNYIRHIYAPTHTPNDTLFNGQWALRNTGQTVNGTTGISGDDIDFTDARRLMMDNPPDVVVAIVDTGADYNHLDLKGAMWVNTNEVAGNGLDDDGNGYIDDIYGYDFAGDRYTDPATGSTNANDGADSDPADILYHGTHVAGIAAATTDNTRGTTGVGRLKIMALKVSEDGEEITSSATLDAAEYMLEMKSRGVNIVAANASYGGGGYSAIEEQVFGELRDAGIIVCAAAGNDASDNDSSPQYPASYNVSNIISVASTDSSDKLSSFSNYGQTSVDVAAPGSLILSSYPAHWDSAASVEKGVSTYSGNGLSFSGLTSSNGISGVLYDCGLGHSNEFPVAVTGNIALIERGDLYFTEKVANAMHAGAAATIIYNKAGETGEVPGTLMRPHSWIPSVGITRADGLSLLSATGQTVTVFNQQDESTSYTYLEGTSMATPFVTGAIGVLAQHFPNDSVTERIDRLLDNADPIAGLATDCVTGARINLKNSLDSDGDELPDWWELNYVGDLTTMNGNSDLDKDGMSDLAEYRTSTDPAAASSQWAVSASTPDPAQTSILLQWASQTGCTYRILATTNLTQQAFTVIEDNINATPPQNEWSVPLTNSPARFYKINFTWE